MDEKEIRQIFYRDGYRLAAQYLEESFTEARLKEAIKALYEAMDGLLEAFLNRVASDGKPCQCRKGCAWCCHQAVFATTHELLYLQEHVDASCSAADASDFLERAREKTLHTLDLDQAQQLLFKGPCPFLKGGACSIYEARPMACRIYLSSSEKSCRQDYERPEAKKHFPQLYEFPLLAGRMLNEGFVAYLKQQGAGSAELPLEQGYASMRTHRQSFSSWLKQAE